MRVLLFATFHRRNRNTRTKLPDRARTKLPLDAVDASGGRKLRFGSLEIGCCRAC